MVRTITIDMRGLMMTSMALVISWLVALPPGHVSGKPLRAGAAIVEITPKLGVLLDGAISKPGPAKGVHDRLYARALVLDDGNTRVGIVICDACMIGRDVIDTAKQIAANETNFNQRHLLVAATHTHSAVRAIHIGQGPLDVEYHTWLSRRIADAIRQAVQKLTPARLGYGSFNKADFLACRRFLCETESVTLNPFGDRGERIKSVAAKSASVIGPAGPVDPQFSILALQHTNASPLAVLGNYSVHYGGGIPRGMISADYFGAYSLSVEGLLAEDSNDNSVVAMLTNGTSGDTGSITKDRTGYDPYEWISVSARELARETMRTLATIDFHGDVTLDAVQSELSLGIRRPSPERLGWAHRVLSATHAEHPHRWTETYAREAIHLNQFPPSKQFLIQAIRVGDIAIVAIPCEVFAETGLAIKSGSPFPHTFIIELANGYGGYLPPPKQHQLGGYETWPARSSHLEVSAEPKIRQAALRLLQQLDIKYQSHDTSIDKRQRAAIRASER